jgi:hypothetical protein
VSTRGGRSGRGRGSRRRRRRGWDSCLCT